MRRYLYILVLLLSVTSLSAQDYGIDLNNNRRMIIGASYSALNWSQTNIAGITTSISIYGIYADIGFNTQGNFKFKGDGTPRNGYKVNSYNIGYTIPISHRFRLTPIIGYMNFQSGIYDCQSVNEFSAIHTDKKINYGFVVGYEVFEALSITATLQRHVIGFGVGLCFNAEDWGI